MNSPSRLGFSVRLFLAVSLLGPVCPRLVTGQVTFFTPPTYTHTADFVADFNGDGKPDLLSKDGTLQLGKGDGTFTMGTPVSGGGLALGQTLGVHGASSRPQRPASQNRLNPRKLLPSVNLGQSGKFRSAVIPPSGLLRIGPHYTLDLCDEG